MLVVGRELLVALVGVQRGRGVLLGLILLLLLLLLLSLLLLLLFLRWLLRLALLLVLWGLLPIHLHHVLIEMLLMMQLSEVNMLLLPLYRGWSRNCWSRTGLLRVRTIRCLLHFLLLLFSRERYGGMYLNVNSVVTII